MKRLSLCALLASLLLLPLVGCKTDTPTPPSTPTPTPPTPPTPNPPTPNPPTPGIPSLPYVTRVLEYRPAPGQFVNTLPEYKDGDTQETMNKKALALVSGGKSDVITLGSWGGYIVVGFDHTIANVAGKRDFRVLGNSLVGGSEAGIVYVAYDKNKNGNPDADEWYEIAGSATLDPTKETWYNDQVGRNFDVKTYRDYTVTYQRPTAETPKDIAEYIRWRDNKGGSGWIPKNSYHEQTYYPQWIKESSYTLSGTRLPQNGYNQSSESPYYVQCKFSYGYADNAPSDSKDATIDIDWAVDKQGRKVYLPGVDFIKIYTGVNQENGNLGECSTEISGITDLHLLKEDIPN